MDDIYENIVNLTYIQFHVLMRLLNLTDYCHPQFKIPHSSFFQYHVFLVWPP